MKNREQRITYKDIDTYNSKTAKAAEEELGCSLSKPSKMPTESFSISCERCPKGCSLKPYRKSVCHSCYASKNSYVWRTTKEAQERRYKALQRDDWPGLIARMIPHRKAAELNYFRWHDAGDIQDVEHLDKIVKVAELRPELHMWLPTLEWETIREYRKVHGDLPANLLPRISSPKINHLVTLNDFEHKSVIVERNEVCESYKETQRKAQEKYGKNTLVCPATYPNRKHECGACRACWSSKCKTIIYIKH